MELDVIREKVEALSSEHHSYLLEYFIRSNVPYRVVDNAVYANISELCPEDIQKVAEYINEVHKTDAEARSRMSANKPQKGYQIQGVPPPIKRKVNKVTVVSFKARAGPQASAKLGLADYSDQQKELRKRLRARRISHSRTRTTHAHAVKTFTSSTLPTLNEETGTAEGDPDDGEGDDADVHALFEAPDETDPSQHEDAADLMDVDPEPEADYLSPDEGHLEPRDHDMDAARVRLPISIASSVEERFEFYRPIFQASGLTL
jgi:hypothetical protein